MRTWFTADTHFGHRKIIDYCSRPFNSVEEMNWKMVDTFNKTVRGDRLVILGDVCMGKLEESLLCLAALEAEEIIILPGNHDRWSLSYNHRGTEEEAEDKREEWRNRYMDARQGIYCLRDEPVSTWTGRELFETGGVLADVLFSHFPYEGDSHGDDRYAERRVKDTGSPIVHGHIHDTWKVRGRQYNVGVDVHDFHPVSEVELAAWVKEIKGI